MTRPCHHVDLDTILKHRNEPLRAANAENVELLRRAFGFPRAPATAKPSHVAAIPPHRTLCPLDPHAPRTHLAPLAPETHSTNTPAKLPPIAQLRIDNAEIVNFLQHQTCNNCNSFHYRTTSHNRVLHFSFMFVDYSEYNVTCYNSSDELRSYPRGNALVSLLLNRTFPGVEAFAIACENALGADIDAAVLTAKIVSDTDVSTFRKVFPTGA
jgi:hypothetical protein